MKKATAPIRFEIPVDAKPQSCLSCGSRIFWILTKTRKKMPCDPDGTSHFATCPNAAKHRGVPRAEMQGDLFGAKK